MVLDEEPRDFMTFSTPFGQYCWLHMPFRISSVPEVFQHRLEAILSGLQGVNIIVDDILVFGEGDAWEAAIEQHIERLLTILHRCLKNTPSYNHNSPYFKCKKYATVDIISHHIGRTGGTSLQDQNHH